MDEAISAGDVERFAYCPLNWQRSVQGDPGAGGQAGLAAHEARAAGVARVGALQRDARFTTEAGFLLALVAISAATLGIELIFLGTGTAVHWILVLLSVMLLAGSLYLFVFNLWFRSEAQRLGADAHVVRGQVEYVDSLRNQEPMLLSDKLPLRGRPDYVVERDGDLVPVEVKTGRTPKIPYDSHVLQLAAYCHLLERTRGVRPEHGVLEYPGRTFEVPYTARVEHELVRTLLRIQLAQATGEAHRDHHSRGRCAGCARRQGCPERLDA